MKKLYLSDVEWASTMIHQLTNWNCKENGNNTAIGYINKTIPVIFKWDLKQLHIHCTSEDWLPLKAIIKDYLKSIKNEHPNVLATCQSNILQYIIEFWEK